MQFGDTLVDRKLGNLNDAAAIAFLMYGLFMIACKQALGMLLLSSMRAPVQNSGCFLCEIDTSPAINILLDILRAATQPGDTKAPLLPVLLLVVLRVGIVNAEDAKPASHDPIKKGTLELSQAR